MNYKCIPLKRTGVMSSKQFLIEEDLRKSFNLKNNYFATMTLKELDLERLDTLVNAMYGAIHDFFKFKGEKELYYKVLRNHFKGIKTQDKVKQGIQIPLPGDNWDSVFPKRILSFISNKNIMIIVMQGKEGIKTDHGRIIDYYIHSEKKPGKLMKDGSFDYREIDKYTFIKKGTKIMSVSYPEMGRHGIRFDGTIEQAEEARPFELEVGKGIQIIKFYGEKKNVDYDLIAVKEGVLIFDKEIIPAYISVESKILVQNIGYDIGNIGRKGEKSLCPLPIEVKDTIKAGFKIYSSKYVEAGTIDNCYIYSQEAIEFRRSTKECMIESETLIKGGRVSGSELRAKEIVIQNEMYDSILSADLVVTNKDEKVHAFNFSINANKVIIYNINIRSGKNIIDLGRVLFNKKIEFKKELSKLCVYRDNRKEQADNFDALIKDNLGLLSTIIKPDLFRKLEKLIHSEDIQTLRKVLEAIKTKKLAVILIDVVSLIEKKEMIMSLKREKELRTELDNINADLNRVSINIKGEIGRGSLIIKCGDDMLDYIPIGSQSKFINFEGSYKVGKGLHFRQDYLNRQLRKIEHKTMNK